MKTSPVMAASRLLSHSVLIGQPSIYGINKSNLTIYELHKK